MKSSKFKGHVETKIVNLSIQPNLETACLLKLSGQVLEPSEFWIQLPKTKKGNSFTLDYLIFIIFAGKVLAVLQIFLGVGEQLGAKNMSSQIWQQKMVNKLFHI